MIQIILCTIISNMALNKSHEFVQVILNKEERQSPLPPWKLSLPLQFNLDSVPLASQSPPPLKHIIRALLSKTLMSSLVQSYTQLYRHLLTPQ